MSILCLELSFCGQSLEGLAVSLVLRNTHRAYKLARFSSLYADSPTHNWLYPPLCRDSWVKYKLVLERALRVLIISLLRRSHRYFIPPWGLLTAASLDEHKTRALRVTLHIIYHISLLVYSEKWIFDILTRARGSSHWSSILWFLSLVRGVVYNLLYIMVDSINQSRLYCAMCRQAKTSKHIK